MELISAIEGWGGVNPLHSYHKATQRQTTVHPMLTSIDNVHSTINLTFIVFGLWKEAGLSRENPGECRKKNIKTSKKQQCKPFLLLNEHNAVHMV